MSARALRRLRARLGARLGALVADESGTTLVEMALAIIVFLALFFGVIDFGRVGYHYVGAERAVMQAARLAAVLPPACSADASFGSIDRDGAAADPLPRMGTLCRTGGVCAARAAISCTAANGDPEALIVWNAVRGVLPAGTPASALTITYRQDANLGFLGGPYTPVVEVALTGVSVTGLSVFGLAGMYGGGTQHASNLALPPMRAEMPGEGLGTGG